MNSIRAFARSAPRTLSRLSASTTHPPLSSLRISSPLRSPPSFHLLRPKFCAAFSTSRTWQERAGAVDDELVAKVASELQMEKEMRDPNELPTSIKDYLENTPFKVKDTPGHEEVELTRQFGDESIKVFFSIADLNTLDTDSDRYDDSALYDEEPSAEDGQSSSAQSKGNKTAPADSSDEAIDSSLSGDQEPSFPARVDVIIEKAGHGAMQIGTVAQDGMIVIDNVYYYPSSDLADAKSAEKDWQRRSIYTGPPFGNLDEDLQVLLERYLDERGVNTALALFIPDYIDHKEQREYVSWLSNVKKFLEA